MIQAHIITIGDELLIGQVVDTNSAFIGARLNEVGVAVGRITSIGDKREAIESTITESLQQFDITIVTGGLGPTKDDITKHSLARIFECKLVRDEDTFNHVKYFTQKRGIEFNTLNQAQADVPSCCKVLQNQHGSAPGMMCTRDGKLLFSLAGVPFEMKALLVEKVIPEIRAQFSLQSVVHRTVMTYGLAESILSERIEAWETALPEWLKLAYLPNPRAIRLRLSAYGVDKNGAICEIEKQFKLLEDLLEENYLGFEPASIESSLGAILKNNGETLAVAESCTGGMISSRITALAGCSSYYKGGVTAYANATKVNILGVKATDIEAYGAVSQTVAEQMAIGVRNALEADYAIATTGIAGPDGGTNEKPVGTVWIAIATPTGVQSQRMQYGTLREQNIERASSNALNMLRTYLLEKSTFQTTTYL